MQESGQSHITKVERKQEREREELIEAENLFGKVIDNYRLDQMALYMGKSKTQEDRAREALNLVDEDGKHVNASRYLSGLKSTTTSTLFNMPKTMCLVYNATGNTLYHIANYDWSGRIRRRRYPTNIGNGQWAAFCHAPWYPGAGSVAAVVYRGKNKDGNDRDYLLAWFIPMPNIPFRRPSNKAYCEIGGVDCFQASWSTVFEKMKNSGNSSVIAQSDGYQIDSKIGEDPLTPWFTAKITSLIPQF